MVTKELRNVCEIASNLTRENEYVSWLLNASMNSLSHGHYGIVSIVIVWKMC